MLGGKINKDENLIESMKYKLTKNNNLLSKKKIENLIKILPSEIFLNNEKEKIIKFLKIINKFKKKSFIQISQNKKKLATEIIIYTKDNIGLLYKLAGAVSISGFNVVEAKVSTLKNGMALDVLWVRDLNNDMLDKLYHFSKLENTLYDVLEKKISINEKKINEVRKNFNEKLFKINTKIFVDNNMSKKHTILEVNTLDRIGLIYDLTKKLYNLKLKISSAKILTMGKGASEIFYIQDYKGKKIQLSNNINSLKRSIKKLLLNCIFFPL